MNSTFWEGLDAVQFSVRRKVCLFEVTPEEERMSDNIRVQEEKKCNKQIIISTNTLLNNINAY